MRQMLPAFLLLAILAPAAHASGGAGITHQMTDLMLQLGIILFAARLGGSVAKKLKLPGVLGELGIGILIGPYLLGGMSGLFHVPEAGHFPISPELYGLATLASIILLFLAGLETDFAMFLRYSLAGSVIGVGGVAITFLVGAVTGMLWFDTGFMDMRCLLLGLMSTPTSVGVTARILSEKRKVDSPEGVTIIAGAVIDDVLGIILLAIILGIAAAQAAGGDAVAWGSIGVIAAKAIGVWLFFTIAGVLAAYKISAFLKTFKSIQVFSILALGMALILAGIFEKAGLAMIIGAYVMGLALSRTDLNFVIQEALHPLHAFLVPVFFTIMGMMIDITEVLSFNVIALGLLFTVGALVAKILGCGIPALGLNFNLTGAWRIGLGMVPRCEVVLIIASIGLSLNLIGADIFGAAVMMILVSAVLAPALLNRSLANPVAGTRKETGKSESVPTAFDFNNPDFTEMLETKVVDYFRSEGFFVHALEEPTGMLYNFRKDATFVTLTANEQTLAFETKRNEVSFIKTIVYEALIEISNIVNKVKDMAKPESMREGLADEGGNSSLHMQEFLDARCIILNMKATTKEEVIEELIDLLDSYGMPSDKSKVLEAIWERENT
ncbi:MAG: cation:proton antiporter domain-containing protein, partial [Planctomycetota bacterium]